MIRNLFMCAGAMKAGTSWLYHTMRHHPQVHFSWLKEIHYFSHQANISNSLRPENRENRGRNKIVKLGRQLRQNKISQEEFRDGIAWYKNYMVGELSDAWYQNLFEAEKMRDAEQFCADFSNLSCFLDEAGWSHVRSLTENLKVIYILRDPVKRLWSHYKFHLLFIDHDGKETPDKDIELFSKFIARKQNIRNAKYSENIGRLRESLHESEFQIFYLDDFSTLPLETLNKLHRFLEISDYSYPGIDLNKKRNSSIEIDLPKEWMGYVKEVLDEEIATLKASGLFREEWTDFRCDQTQP